MAAHGPTTQRAWPTPTVSHTRVGKLLMSMRRHVLEMRNLPASCCLWFLSLLSAAMVTRKAACSIYVSWVLAGPARVFAALHRVPHSAVPQ